MDDYIEGKLEGLRAAALLCQSISGQKNSIYSEKIMKMHNTIALKESFKPLKKENKND